MFTPGSTWCIFPVRTASSPPHQPRPPPRACAPAPCSASGRSISVVWPELRAYTVFTLAPTGTWEVVDKGEPLQQGAGWCG